MSASDWPHADSVGAEVVEEDELLLVLDEAVVVVGGGVDELELEEPELPDELELEEPELDELDPLEPDESPPGSGSREPGGLVRSRELEPLEPLESPVPSSLESLPVEPLPLEPVDEPRDELPPLQPLADTAPARATTRATRTKERPQEGMPLIMVHPHWPAPAAAGPGPAASTTRCDRRGRA